MGILGNWLPEDPQQNAAARQGLLALGGAMMSAKGSNFLGTLGQGLLAGGEGYQGALQQQQQQQLMATQQKRWELENRETQAKLDEPMAIAALLGPAAGSGGSNAAPSFSSAPQMSAPATPGAPAGPVGPAAGFGQPRPPEQQYAQLMDYANRLTQSGRVAQAKVYYDMADRLRPKLKETRAQTDANNNRMMVNYFEDGSHAIVKDVLPDAEKLNFQNTGGATVGLNPFTGEQVSTIANSATPGEKLAAETARRAQLMKDQRDREFNEITKQGQRSQIINDPTQGPIVVDKGTGQARQVTLNGQAVPGEAVAKREASAKTLLPLIGQARKLIGGATGSYLGAAADEGARLFGVATNGAQNIAQLKVLEGNFMMAQPRMEGPQSNMDVALYRQMAAQIGDPTVPIPTKMAALNTLESLYAKYAPETQAPAGSGKPPIKPVKQILREQKSGIPTGWTVKEK